MRRGNLSVVLCLLLLKVMCAAYAQAAGSNTLAVAATVISKNECKFNSKAKTETLDFGSIDPAWTADVTKTTTVQFVCNGSSTNATFVFTSDDGLNKTGPGANRMQHATVTTEYLPYSLSLSPKSATVPKGVDQTLTITGTVSSLNYRSAYAGAYSDTVVISLSP